MNHWSYVRWAVAAVLACALALPAAGCGGGKVDSNSYSVSQSGTIVGSQTVKIRETGRAVIYTGAEEWPHTEFGDTVNRTFKASSDLKGMLFYRASRKVPGATYRTYIDPVEGGFSFLDDRLETFSFAPLLPGGQGVIPVEPDSACMMQALLDRFLASGVSEAYAFVVVPSGGATVRQVFVQRRARYRMSVSGEGFPGVEVTFDRNSFVTGVRAGDILIRQGPAPPLAAKPFEPRSAGRVDGVKVRTPEKLPGGDNLELGGRLYFPGAGRKPFPAVILTGDGGPMDVTGGGFLSQVAVSLAGKGFAVLVCARRGVPSSGGSFARATRKVLVGDIDSQVDYLVNRGDIDREEISLLGYGEGGLLSAAAAGANPYVSKLVLMATPSLSPFPDMARLEIDLALQRGEMSDEDAAFERSVIDGLIGLVQGTTADYADVGGRRVFLDWMRSWMAEQPAQQLAALKVPVLVAQGSADRSVPAAQAGELMRALSSRPGGVQELRVFDGLGHAFGRELTQAESVPYRRHPVTDPGAFESVADWLKEK